MTEKPQKAKICLQLTEGQKEQLREATGREVDMLELRVEFLAEPTRLPAPRANQPER